MREQLLSINEIGNIAWRRRREAIEQIKSLQDEVERCDQILRLAGMGNRASRPDRRRLTLREAPLAAVALGEIPKLSVKPEAEATEITPRRRGGWPKGKKRRGHVKRNRMAGKGSR